MEPFLSEIVIFSFNFAPKGFALCNGQLLPINQNQALFALLGTTFGGDGRVNFALPDLRGRALAHVGSGFTLGQRTGEQAHTLNVSELPVHIHESNKTASSILNINASSVATSGDPDGRVFAGNPNFPNRFGEKFDEGFAEPPVNTTSTQNEGGGQAHLNMMPFLTLNYCIALQGIFPSPN
ncbi:phage tail protein [Belliella aquatica]|uniref:Tail Collar domain-containing protein n=1 Tax=Belliella aquatica TaxID=1323734 RepID=A0ABQ1MYS0_9BACT|nr:tail fiber protein [Belliella aquatica]MCH7407451.1 tail fiber protein [Belliella aquatica]GGC49314.1 tail Collar domain-containing protein [Belliella aquatica]